MNLYYYMREKERLKRSSDATCSHMLAAMFCRNYRDEEYYCLSCRKRLNKNELWHSYVFELFQEPDDDENIQNYLEKLDKEVDRLYESGMDPDFKLEYLASYLFNFACEGFKNPYGPNGNQSR